MVTKPVRRMTNQRRVILEELKKLHSHPTADELYQLVRRHLPRVSIATVYRNLEILCSEGLAQKMDIPGTQRRFDGDTNNHYHVRCLVCGRVEDLDFDPIPNIEQTIRNRSEYKVLSHRLEFIGLCPACLSSEGQDLDT